MGFVYLAANTNDSSDYKIGQCLNIRKELQALNNPSALEDKSHCPYALLSFIVGFAGDPTSDNVSASRETVALYMRVAPFWSVKWEYRYAKLMSLFRSNFFELHDRLLRTNIPWENLVLKECYDSSPYSRRNLEAHEFPLEQQGAH